MQIKTEAILLKATRYADNGRILKIFTLEHGLETFFINSVKGKSAVIKPSFLQPLTLSTLVYAYKSNSNFQRISECQCAPVHRAYTDPARLSIIIFMQEVLNKCIIEKFIHPPLFYLIKDTIMQVENTNKGLGNIPAAFLSKLSAVLGFSPKTDTYFSGSVLSAEEGIFELQHASGEDAMQASNFIVSFISEDYAQILEKEISRQVRKNILDQISELFSHHQPGFKEIISPNILSHVLA